MGQFGFDGLWIETEHAPTTWEQLTNATRACDLWGVTSVCRVTTNDTSLITRTLDSGCTGIAVPHVNTKAEAEKAAKSAKYSPLGYRGMGAGRQSYGEPDYYRTANEETLVIAFIEEVEAVENLDEILTVDNIDVFFMAPSDLAASMGVPWNPWSAEPEPREVTETVDRCIRKIVDAGRTAGFLAREETLESVYDQGVRFFLTNWGPWVAKGARSYLDKVSRIEG